MTKAKKPEKAKEELKPVKRVFPNAHEHLASLEERLSLVEASLGIVVANGGPGDGSDGGPGEEPPPPPPPPPNP